MMRVVTVLFLLCLVGGQAADYVQKYFKVDSDRSKPGASAQLIRYLIKKQDKFVPHAPVFYGCGGRVAAAELRASYDLFDDILDKYYAPNSATVVYVEQRFFGASNATDANLANFAALADLNLNNVINDHIELIKALSKELNTTHFLVFGGGHGGIIAGYLADTFSRDTTLKNIKVFGWSSSPPLKYMASVARDGNSLPDFRSISSTISNLLVSQGGCVQNTVGPKLGALFGRIRGLQDNIADNAILNALRLTPTPRGITNADPNRTDLQELAVFIRNKIFDLAFNDPLFARDNTGGPITPRNFKRLCDAIANIRDDNTNLIDAAQINGILSVLDARDQIPWKLKNGNTLNPELAARYYQDCTELRLFMCTNAEVGNSDIFRNTQWVPGQSCNTFAEYNTRIQEECQGLFGENTITPSNYNLDLQKFPRSFQNNVLTTFNTLSAFYGSFSLFGSDTGTYAAPIPIWGTDNWEFGKPRSCDTDTIRDVRFLALRAFGCQSGIISGCPTTNLFSDGVTLDTNSPANLASCPADTSDTGRFPFGRIAPKFSDPDTPVKTTVSTVLTSTVTVLGGGGTQQTTLPTTTTGAGSLVPGVAVFLSSLLIWLSAHTLRF